MSLQRRILLYLLVCAPLVWALGLVVSINRAQHEVNELFDTAMIQLARQMQATLHFSESGTAVPAPVTGSQGEADVRDLAIAVWDAKGKLLLSDREGIELTRRPDAAGFVADDIQGEAWRVYYLQSVDGEWLVAAGQKVEERDELVFSLTASQIVPWLLLLPLLLLAMVWAVRRALLPVRQLTAELQARDAGDLHPVPNRQTPVELQPLVGAMNGLFTRIEDTLARERRFTADAAHELRTPLAVLRAQWDVVRRAAGPERASAEAKLTAGMDRMDRLVTQMLALSRVEASTGLPLNNEVNWPDTVAQVINDCLPLAERRHVELACDWPPEHQHPLPLLGNAALMTVMLRNLLDNAVRYAPEGSLVTLKFSPTQLVVENAGPPLEAEQIARLGERFHRPEGQVETGSGLGVSIVQRIAALHGLSVSYGAGTDGQGVRVTLTYGAAPSA